MVGGAICKLEEGSGCHARFMLAELRVFIYYIDLFVLYVFAACGSCWGSPTMWVPDIELPLPGLAASSFTH